MTYWISVTYEKTNLYILREGYTQKMSSNQERKRLSKKKDVMNTRIKPFTTIL